MKKLIFFIFLFFSFCAKAQILPTFYPSFESNRGQGNGKLFYRLYSLSSSLAFPNSEAEMDAFYNTYGTFRLKNSVSIATNSGTINSSTSRVSNIINYNVTAQFTSAIGTSTPYSGFNGDTYGLIITGYFIPKQSGTYKFSIEGDDAVDIFINGTNVANHYGGHGASAIGTHTGSITLIAGKKYNLRVRFMENIVGDELYLFWQKPSETNGSIWYQDTEELSTEEVLPSGLVLNIDPSNMYSYPKTGTTVDDLVSVTSGTLGGNMTYTSTALGTFQTDGNGDYIDFGKTPTNFPATGDMSIFVWLRATTLNNGWNIFLTKWFSDLQGTNTYKDFHYAIYPKSGVLYQNLYTRDYYDYSGSISLTTNTWYQLGFTITNGSMQMYVNAQLDGTARPNTRINYTQTNLWLGDARVGVGGLIGNIGSIQIYNRGISQDEVFQNFNATKHKYGL